MTKRELVALIAAPIYVMHRGIRLDHDGTRRTAIKEALRLVEQVEEEVPDAASRAEATWSLES